MSRLACIRAVVAATWQCFACSTWNKGSSGACTTCGYDRYGFDTA
ncbi:hypothetical protein [Nocardiopsis dassonvillei]|nr:hypothetical protein [Nocardiopsis dassonvillei]